jgi:transposase, IS5 family
MLIDKYQPEDVFARVPELAAQTDPVLKQLDVLLDDDQLYQQVRADLGKRYKWTLVHGRHSTPVEVLLRMLILKHLYDWSFQETEERVKDSLVLRWFSRVYFEKVPDDTTLIRWAKTLRPETVHALVDRVAELAKEAKVTKGRKLRLDGTCVQTNIHHPTDSSLLVDGVRVLSRIVKQGKRVDHRPRQRSLAVVPLAAAFGTTNSPRLASTVAAQRGRKGSRAKGEIPETHQDSRADGPADQTGR